MIVLFLSPGQTVATYHRKGREVTGLCALPTRKLFCCESQLRVQHWSQAVLPAIPKPGQVHSEIPAGHTVPMSVHPGGSCSTLPSLSLPIYKKSDPKGLLSRATERMPGTVSGTQRGPSILTRFFKVVRRLKLASPLQLCWETR